jgi:hypothetical protein
LNWLQSIQHIERSLEGYQASEKCLEVVNCVYGY